MLRQKAPCKKCKRLRDLGNVGLKLHLDHSQEKMIGLRVEGLGGENMLVFSAWGREHVRA